MATLEELREAIRKIEADETCSYSFTDTHMNGASDEEAPSVGSPSDTPSGTEDKDEHARALSKIARLVSATEKSSVQLKERLIREGFDSDIADGAIARAQELGIVDDLRYAEWLVRSRLRQGRGLPGIERELSEIGITLQDLRGWPEEFDYSEDEEVERACAFLDAHPPRSKDMRGSAYRKLVTKGFSSSTAVTASRRWCEKNMH